MSHEHHPTKTPPSHSLGPSSRFPAKNSSNLLLQTAQSRVNSHSTQNATREGPSHTRHPNQSRHHPIQESKLHQSHVRVSSTSHHHQSASTTGGHVTDLPTGRFSGSGTSRQTGTQNATSTTRPPYRPGGNATAANSTAGYYGSLITVPPAGPTGQRNVWSVHTFPNVTGKPNSYSQTTTTNRNGSPTILPVWFNSQGQAVVVSLDSGPGGSVPSPFGFFDLFIDALGNAEPGNPDDHHDDDDGKHSTPSNSQSPTSHSSTSGTSSHSSSSTGRNSTSLSTTANITIISTTGYHSPTGSRPSAGWPLTNPTTLNGTATLHYAHPTGRLLQVAGVSSSLRNSSSQRFPTASGNAASRVSVHAPTGFLPTNGRWRTGVSHGFVGTSRSPNVTGPWHPTGTAHLRPNTTGLPHTAASSGRPFPTASVGLPYNATIPEKVLQMQRLIFPKDGKDPHNSEITAKLSAIKGSRYTIMQDPLGGIDLWLAILTDRQVESLEADPLVGSGYIVHLRNNLISRRSHTSRTIRMVQLMEMMESLAAQTGHQVDVKPADQTRTGAIS